MSTLLKVQRCLLPDECGYGPETDCHEDAASPGWLLALGVNTGGVANRAEAILAVVVVSEAGGR